MPFSLLAHQSTILPLATAGLLGAGMARLSYILMDVLDDDSSEARTDQRIRLLDRVMRLKAKPGVVVVEASDADVDGGLYRPEDWRSEQIQDYAARTCQTACLTAEELLSPRQSSLTLTLTLTPVSYTHLTLPTNREV